MRFRPNPLLEAELRRSPGVRDALRDAADSAGDHAAVFARAAGAPWMPRKGRRLIEVEDTPLGARLVNTDHGAHLLEWGGANNPPHAPLRRGVRAAGLRFIENGK